MSQDAFSTKLPPHSIEAEQGVLGCIFSSPLESIEFCAALGIEPSSFYDLRHQIIYSNLINLALQARAIDTITLYQAIKYQQKDQTVGGMPYISSLADLGSPPAAIGEYASIVQAHATARATIRLCVETASDAYEKAPGEWLDNFRERASTLRLERNIEGRSIGALQRPPDDDPTELLKHRYLCESGILLVNGPTGLGKSSFVLQALACWSNGLPFFDIKPNGLLSAVLVQAENDDGDLAEMRDGICTGLKFNQEQRTNFFEKVLVFTSNGTVGRSFCLEVIQPLLITHKPNLICIDPALAFIGGDTKEQKDVGAFLRTWLLPLLFAYHVGCVLVHHTNKPLTGREKPNWRNGELSYTGSGSSEYANAVRAVLAIQDTGTHGLYRLHAAKRGARLGWRAAGDDTTRIYEKVIGHAKEPGLIYWRDASEDEIDEPGAGGRPKSFEKEELLDLLGDSGLTSGEWEKQAAEFCGVKSRTLQRALKDFQRDNLILKSKIDRKWKRIIK